MTKYSVSREDEDHKWTVVMHSKKDAYQFLVNLIRSEGDDLLDRYIHSPPDKKEEVAMEGRAFTLLGVADSIERNIIFPQRYESNSVAVGPINYSYKRM